MINASSDLSAMMSAASPAPAAKPAAPIASSVLFDNGMPWAFPFNATETLDALIACKGDINATFAICQSFHTWLAMIGSPHAAYFDGKMPAGVLDANARLVIRAIMDPSFSIEDLHLNREGRAVVFGSAGTDHEYRKMRRGLEALRLAIFDEAQEHGKCANAAERCAAEAREEGDEELALACAEEAVTERGLFAVKLDLARQIQAELDADDRDAMVRRYRLSGAREVVTETTIAVEVGSLASAHVTESGEVVVTAGEAYVMPEASEATKRAIRCAQATGAHDSFNRIEGDNF